MFLKYTHPANCGYDINKSYDLNELKQKLDVNAIKIMFTPIDFKWEDIEKKEVVKETEVIEIKKLDEKITKK